MEVIPLYPILQREDGIWTFWDETGDELAKQALNQYTHFLNTGEVTGSLLLVDES
jgi:hypothetical protein